MESTRDPERELIVDVSSGVSDATKSASEALARNIATEQGEEQFKASGNELNGKLIDHLTVTGGVRYDHHQTYGGHALLSGGAVWSSVLIQAS